MKNPCNEKSDSKKSYGKAEEASDSAGLFMNPL